MLLWFEILAGIVWKGNVPIQSVLGGFQNYYVMIFFTCIRFRDTWVRKRKRWTWMYTYLFSYRQRAWMWERKNYNVLKRTELLSQDQVSCVCPSFVSQ